MDRDDQWEDQSGYGEQEDDDEDEEECAQDEEVKLLDNHNDSMELSRLNQINIDLQQIDTEIYKLTTRRKVLEQQQHLIEQQIFNRKRKLQESLEPDWVSSSVFPWSLSVQKLAYELFGFHTLRPGQWEIMNAGLSNYDVFAVMKTGGGKSLCYQIPSLLNTHKSSTTKSKLSFTVVVSPLLALIRDQVQGMNSIVPNSALSLAGKMERAAQSAVYHAMNHLSESHLKLLYVTPEKIIKSKLLMTHLQRAYNDGSVQRIVIDEAHCMSQW